MPAAFGSEAHASDATTTLTSLACNKPAGTAAGDFLIATVSTGSGSSAFTAPGGWSTALASWTDSNDSAGAVFSLVAGASEPASYTFSWTTAADVNISIIRVTGSNGVIRGIRRDSAGGTGASFTSTALAGTQAGDLIIATGVEGDDNGITGSTITPPGSPWATINNFAAGPKYQASSWLAGPQGSQTATFTSSSATAWWNIITYAVEAAPAAAGGLLLASGIV